MALSSHRTLGWLVVLPLLAATALAQEPSGEQLFKTQCARCHGPKGEGTKRYQKHLEGDRSVAQLSSLIHKTMPEDGPGTLSEPEAKAVAAFVFDSFYSPLARARNRPARIELARLTVRQYRNAVADLVGSFRWQPAWGKERGLKAEYFRNRRFSPRDRVLERIDPQVAFDFGTDSPVPGKAEPHEFSIRWNGSVLAPQTGEYEIVVRTEHATRLWLNDQRVPLIDAWVKSGHDTEYKGTITLVAGRVYPLRLEYSKAKQGVDDSKTNKRKPPAVKSSIALLWKAPGRAHEPIPARQLAPTQAPEGYVCTTAFPPDDRSYGWERGTTISKEWDQATTDAALELAGYLDTRLNELAGTREGAADRSAKLKAFCRTFAERAFRRPLTDAQKEVVDRQFATAKEPELGVKRVVLMVLKSPRFLYREINPGSDGYDVAARLAFALWDSMPDRELLDAAARGQLTTPEQVRRHAERMLADPRARTKLRDFLLTWLKADHGLDLAKDAKRFPGFDNAVISDLKTSLELFLDDVLWSEPSDYRQLLLTEDVYLNQRLAKFYGTQVKGSGFEKVKLDAGQRAGVLSHPYLMTSFAYTAASSPIHRGVFLARGVLGVALRSPPEAAAPLPADLHPNLTTRERVVLQTRPAGCMTCHCIINPLGFTLEHFDAVGRYREKDSGKPVDSLGAYQTRDGKMVRANGARELAAFVVGSEEAHTAFVEQLFHYLVQQSVRAYGPTALADLRRSFVRDNFHMRKLAVDVVTMTALKPRQVAAAGR
ncbi:MAG: DUF1592 domain-containing protein [Gemmataceae bacterium]